MYYSSNLIYIFNKMAKLVAKKDKRFEKRSLFQLLSETIKFGMNKSTSHLSDFLT